MKPSSKTIVNMTSLAMLVLAVILLYGQMIQQDYINFDDQGYILKNTHIQNGLNLQSIKWAFTTTRQSNYHPLTWLSLILDYQIAGGKPWPFKLTNLLLHLINTLLLYLLLKQMTRAHWPSLLVAALFALHPLHVESVAWVSERKDVLSTALAFLTLIGYVHYTHRPNRRGYLFTLVAFIAGLLAKPMLVTLPCLMLLLDYWPINRSDPELQTPISRHSKRRTTSLQPRQTQLKPIWEKIPFLLLAAASCWVTIYAQRQGHAIKDIWTYPLDVRVSNALAGYAGYLGKMIWPQNLAVYYPHPKDALTAAQVITAALILLSITIVALRYAKRYRWLPVGWFWYLGTLVPVIGLIQVGSQAIADRYTYIPLIGIFIIIAWLAKTLIEKRPRLKYPFTVGFAIVIILLSIQTYKQIACWKNSTALFTHAVQVVPNNGLAYNCLGLAMVDNENLEKAEDYFRKAVSINPDRADFHFDLAKVLYDTGRFEESLIHCNLALQRLNDYIPALRQRKEIYLKFNNIDAAIEDICHILAFEPDDAKLQFRLAELLCDKGRHENAVKFYLKAIQLDPQKEIYYVEAAYNFFCMKQIDQAVALLRRAIQANPGFQQARQRLEQLLSTPDSTQK